MIKKSNSIINIFSVFLIAYSISSLHLSFIGNNYNDLSELTKIVVNILQILFILAVFIKKKVSIYWLICIRILDCGNSFISNGNILMTLINNVIIIIVFYIFYKEKI